MNRTKEEVVMKSRNWGLAKMEMAEAKHYCPGSKARGKRYAKRLMRKCRRSIGKERIAEALSE